MPTFAYLLPTRCTPRRFEMVKEKGLLNLPDSKTGPRPSISPTWRWNSFGYPPNKRAGSSSAGGRSGTSRSRACRRNGSASERSPACRTVRLNDLRHRYASLGVEDPQLSLSMIGGLLGHKEPRTTARYAHLSAHPMRKAANRIGARFLEAINASTPEKADLER